jgi:SPP1 family predicted phage head-tail adaptor
MPGPKYHKNHKVLIFYEIDQKPDPIKQYIHAQGTKLSAYARQLTSSETAALNAIQDSRYVEFVINKRKLEVDMFVEFKGKTYQISAVDDYDFMNPETKFQAYEVNSKSYVDVRWIE